MNEFTEIVLFKVSDVKRWLENCTKEAEGERTNKEELWQSFVLFRDLKNEVGRDTFFAFLGIALSNVSYNAVPVLKRGRRVGYKGISIR